MLDIGWTEMLVIAIVMIVVVGPKDLPKMLRTFGKTTSKLRAMAGDFRKQFDEALKEAELDDVKKSVESLRGLNPTNEIKKHINPFQKAAADVRAGLDAALKPPAMPVSPVPVPHTADPLKFGATNMPGGGDAPATPPAPIMTAAPPADEAAAAAAAAGAPIANAKATAKAKPRAAAKPASAKPAADAPAKATDAPAAKPKRVRKPPSPKDEAAS